MAHPLEDYRKIGNISFIEKTDFEFYERYCYSLNAGLVALVDRPNERLIISGFDIELGEFNSYTSIYTFFEQEYSKLEMKARNILDNVVLEVLDEKKQELFIKSIIAELQDLQNVISSYKLEGTNEKLKTILSNKVGLFAGTLSTIYLNAKIVVTDYKPKIQWLGNTNLLATLLFDLWKGQEISKNKKTKELLKAEKKDLEALLLNNFIDADGNPLKASTISDYLNISKPEKRAKPDVRIGINVNS